jgi:hypothetical protein
MHVFAALKARPLIASAAALTLVLAAVAVASIFATATSHNRSARAASDAHGKGLAGTSVKAGSGAANGPHDGADAANSPHDSADATNGPHDSADATNGPHDGADATNSPHDGAGAQVDPPAGVVTTDAPKLLATPAPTGRPVSVSVATHPVGQAVAANFLGLSFEVRDLPTLAGYATKGDLVALLRSLGAGVMRFGGISADEQAAWVPAGASKPAWASTAIDEGDLAGIATLAKETGWSVLLTVNLGHYEPAAAAQEAAAAHVQLGRYLAGIEIGNEPDLFPRKHLRPPGTGVRAYLPQAAAYRAAIEAAAPGVPIAGPDVSTGVQGFTWVRDAAATLHPQLLTDHYYPLSSCGNHPTISELLSPNVRRKESEMLTRMVALARAYKTPLRMDETNDISCEGEPGVSDTFASALWALDYTARAIAAGTAGVNFHDLIAQPESYSALAAHGSSALAAGELKAAPEWYALLAAHIFMGARQPCRPLDTSATGAAPGELTASAVSAPDGKLQLVLVDYDPPGSTPLAVHLRVARALAGGSILRLTGPSPAATTGVLLGGRAVASDGDWTMPSALPAVYGHAGSLSVQLAPDSAAVVTLAPRSLLGRVSSGR